MNDSVLKKVPIDKIKQSIHQPRKHFDDASLLELSNSLKQNGLVQPIIVRKKQGDYEIVQVKGGGGQPSWQNSQQLIVLLGTCQKNKLLHQQLLKTLVGRISTP